MTGSWKARLSVNINFWRGMDSGQTQRLLDDLDRLTAKAAVMLDDAKCRQAP